MIRIIAVGKMRDKRLSQLVDDYMKRIRTMAPVEVIEVRDSTPEREDRDLVGKLGSAGGREMVLAMDELGEELTSVEFSKLLGAHGGISFVIGGADGLGAGVRERASRTVRLSSMTFTHEMARVLLAEQIYRGLSILRGKPYHRG